ncbi:MAG: hypothetical protein WKF61_08795 [Luteimonas sp.]
MGECADGAGGLIRRASANPSAASDIDYFYASRLAGEPEEGIEDIHFHPFEPRALRLSLSWKF